MLLGRVLVLWLGVGCSSGTLWRRALKTWGPEAQVASVSGAASALNCVMGFGSLPKGNAVCYDSSSSSCILYAHLGCKRQASGPTHAEKCWITDAFSPCERQMIFNMSQNNLG